MSFCLNHGITWKILKHLDWWDLKARSPTKRANATPSNIHVDYSYCQVPTSDDYLFVDAEYPEAISA